ncbi:hypothetical protein COCVIDRAFT_24660 [Bipolaris victoriae FI3]|uniref:Fungal calcium binding protein domain-containing protein n=1 Tax=Bipolaris victoriae (strain FI3) TaxID=930091 RepID=W7EZB3_BIPV3|nr:hypothetical protein COCVIDRAFT_24660 [Bipolaris victoriae FI3]
MQFTTSTLLAFSALLVTINAATVVGPAPAGQTHTTVIKHLAYRCPAKANANQCASATAKLRLKEDNGCDVLACTVAAASTLTACTAAVSEGGLNPIADLACILAGGISDVACKGCA